MPLNIYSVNKHDIPQPKTFPIIVENIEFGKKYTGVRKFVLKF